MYRHEIALMPAYAQDRVRHRIRGGANWTGILLSPSAVCLQEQDISRRDLQDVGDLLGGGQHLRGYQERQRQERAGNGARRYCRSTIF